MAENILQEVLERAFSDQQFRSRLESGLEEALEVEGYKLSSDERRQLKSILDEGKDTFATGLDQRLSQSGVSLSPQALLRQKSKAANKQSGLQRHPESGAGRKQTTRQVHPADSSVPSGRQAVKGPSEKIDDREPDYEVETD